MGEAGEAAAALRDEEAAVLFRLAWLQQLQCVSSTPMGMPLPRPAYCVKDPHIPREGRAKVWQALEEAGVTFTWHEFNGQHAFMRDEGPRYDPELALQARIGGVNWEIFTFLFQNWQLYSSSTWGAVRSRPYHSLAAGAHRVCRRTDTLMLWLLSAIYQPSTNHGPLQVYSLLVSFFRRKLGDGCLTPAKDTSTASQETKH